MVFAGVEPVLVEEGSNGGLEVADVEDGFDGAVFGAAADEGAVGTFAQGEFQGADDDGFAGAGFAGDRGIAGVEADRQFVDEGEVTDAERCEHGALKGPGVGYRQPGLCSTRVAVPGWGRGLGLGPAGRLEAILAAGFDFGPARFGSGGHFGSGSLTEGAFDGFGGGRAGLGCGGWAEECFELFLEGIDTLAEGGGLAELFGGKLG